MKTINLTIIFITFLGINALGQDFPTDSAYWKTNHSNVICLDSFGLNALCWEKQYFLQNDTIIQNVDYNKIFCNGRTRNNNGSWTYFDEGYIGATRYENETKKVYFRPVESSEEYLLYDFDLNIGDTLPTSYVYDPEFAGIITIDFIDTVIIAGDSIKRFHMDEAGFGGEYIINGIGSSLGLLEEISPYFEHSYTLLCFENLETSITYPESGNCTLITDINDSYFEKSINVTLFPNPTKGRLSLNINEISNIKYEIQIIDLLGKVLYKLNSNENTSELNLEHFQSGMYILLVTNENRIISRKKIIKK